ncbi:MAG: DUF5777 family beta-barrel protein [Saprospiraceae bacterium]
MKLIIKSSSRALVSLSFILLAMLFVNISAFAQDEAEAPVKAKPVKNTFSSTWLIDNQTVMVPVQGTFQMDIQHRFGTFKTTKATRYGYNDLFGLFAPSNIRMGFNYAPIKNLFVGFGMTKEKWLWDVNVKYAIIQQTPHKYPVSVSYYANAALNSQKANDVFAPKSGYALDKLIPAGKSLGSEGKFFRDRVSYFHQLLIARKVTNALSVQVAPSFSYQNAVAGFLTNPTTKTAIMKNGHFALNAAAKYNVTESIAVMATYDQPLTKHPYFNPQPSLGFGIEMGTSGHAFQLFVSNYSLLSPQRNSLYNQNIPFPYTNPTTKKTVDGGQWLIGFNITRLWN